MRVGAVVRFLAKVICALAVAGCAIAFAQSSSQRAPQITVDDDGALLTGDFNFSLGSALEDALSRGVSLYFVLEIDVVRERLLLNDSVTSRSDTFRLAYVPLTRSWRLSSGLYSQNPPTLEAATRQFTRLRSTKVADRKQLQKGERYVVTARLRHDSSQLPKPMQLSTLGSREWAIESEPIRVSFVAP